LGEDGSLICYAIFAPGTEGWFKLQVSSSVYSDFLHAHNVGGNGTALNI